MKRIATIAIAAAALLAVSCKPKSPAWEVNATLQDGVFTWSNDIVSYSVNVQDPLSQGRPTCGISAKVKDQEGNMHTLESDQFLGYGASAPVGISGFYLPERPCRNAEVIRRTPDQIIIHLAYDGWQIDEAQITLDKQITLSVGSPIMKVIDYYNGPFEKLNVAIGLPAENIFSQTSTGSSIISSDANGITTILSMPQADSKPIESAGHMLLRHEVSGGEALYYYVGISADGPDLFLEEIDNLN